MKKENSDVLLGKFYGRDIVIKDADILPKEEWRKMWREYLLNEKKHAIEAYKEKMFLKELEKKIGFFQKLRLLFKNEKDTNRES